MSGIEVVGLVLAVFPGVVRGLQQFAQRIATSKPWKRYSELSSLSRTLETQQVVFLNTIERIFEGIIQSNEELEALVGNLEAAIADRSQYEKALRVRLGRSYDIFCSLMQALSDSLRLAREEIGIDDKGKMLWDDHSCLERHAKKLKLALCKKLYMGLLAQVKELNRELKEFANESLILETSRAKRRHRAQGTNFTLIRRHASSLYDLLVTRRLWKCRCWKQHMVSLCLEPRWDHHKIGPIATITPNGVFRVLLSKEQTPDGLGYSWKGQLIEVEPIEWMSVPSSAAAHSESESSKPAKQSISQASGLVKSTKTVKFATPPASLPSNELRGFTAPARSTTDIDPITDICTAIEGVKGDHCRVGYLTDEKMGLYSHNICLIDKQVWSEKDAKSLDCLLKLSQHQISGYMLSRRDRLYIAFTLASSVLQLGGTSWLRENWRIGDISVLPSDAQRPEVFKMDYSHLYVSWKLLSNDPDTRLTTEAVQGPAARQIRNQYLFALGIVLIELSLKQKLSNRRLPEDFQPNEAMTDFNTATRLVNEVYDESGSRYGGVVQRCLTCPFNLRDLRNFSLDNKEFQEAVFDHILTPLRQDYEDFNGFQRIR